MSFGLVGSSPTPGALQRDLYYIFNNSNIRISIIEIMAPNQQQQQEQQQHKYNIGILDKRIEIATKSR